MGIVAASVLAFVHFRQLVPETHVVLTTILPPDKTAFAGPVKLSPDGQRIVFAATGEDGKRQLWVRPLDATNVQLLQGTEGGQLPFWSPDSRWVGFFAEGKLKKIDTHGGPPIPLTDALAAEGGSWSAKGVIVFAPNDFGLKKISSNGGEATPATMVDATRRTFQLHCCPWFLPDGEHFLFLALNKEGRGHDLLVGSLNSTASKFIGESDSNAAYAEGRLIYLKDSRLMAQPFDLNALRPNGVAEGLEHSFNAGAVGEFSVSASGLLAYQTAASANVQLTWFDRKGKRLGTVGERQLSFETVEFSPDGKAAVVSATDAAGNNDLWIYGLTRGLRTRFTFDPAIEFNAVWSPDGRTIMFNSNRKGYLDVYRKPATNPEAEEELLYADDQQKMPTSWSPNGKFLLYTAGGPGPLGWHLWVLPLTPERPGGLFRPIRFLQTTFNHALGRFSPDGHWVAYNSNASQKTEIYISPFSRPSEKYLVSPAGGFRPRWRQDGKEILYAAPGGKLMAAEVRIKGDIVEIGAVRTLFGGIPIYGSYAWDVSADGQRILVAVPPKNQNVPALITLVQNWIAGLKK